MKPNNYQKILDDVLTKVKTSKSKPTLLLHCCCAPCSSYVFEYLVPYFNITALFYNPNISPKTEYDFRLNELKRLIFDMNFSQKINLIEELYEPQKFKEISLGLENCPEGSLRCFKCYYLRLQKTAFIAKKLNFDYFTTTLTISPYKNANRLNEIGAMLASEYGTKYLFSDFKKKDGYKHSIELSKKYNLYRQNYCGCKFSKKASV
ncbi:uncharacterized protein BN706_00518 [Clostridium sp. CAG:557]|jgi:predicted adenine nucleotide alpha hydrolase (AANH) superfamily ATPase|nr:uncharacterized protein BN706_00518 [Clostridium sp. CAG:557]